MVQHLDICCPRGHCLSNSTASKVQTQETTAKKSMSEESRPKKLKLAEGKNPVLLYSESMEPGKTFYINKRREYPKKKRDRKNNTPATKNNSNAIEIGKKKWNNQGDGRYYNCQKKGHFLKNCPEPPKNSCQFWQPPCQ